VDRFGLVFNVLLLFLLSIASASAQPAITWQGQTPANGSIITVPFVELNASIDVSSLDTFVFNWNGTNHSIYDSSLVLALNFNNNSEIGETSSKAVDISRYGNNGTINGAVWTSSGRFGSALQFDGVDDYVDCGNGASLNITTAVTVEAWVNPLYSGWTRKNR